MLLLSPSRLPDFDQAAFDRRYLTELDRLMQLGLFDSYQEFARTTKIRAGKLSEIEKGRYHCNVKMLYELVRYYPQADLNFIFFGSAVFARPEPPVAPDRGGKQGRRPTRAGGLNPRLA